MIDREVGGRQLISTSSILCPYLSSLSSNLGEMNQGNIRLRNVKKRQRRVEFGEDERGLVAYDERNRPYFRLSYELDYFRIGYPDATHIEWTPEGGVRIHGMTSGELIMEHSISPSSLIIGDFVRGIMDTDEIRIGQTDDSGLFTGLVGNQYVFSTYYKNTPNVFVDQNTGNWRSGVYVGGYFIGVDIGSSVLSINSEVFNALDRPNQYLHMVSYANNEGDLLPQIDAYLYGGVYGLTLENANLHVKGMGLSGEEGTHIGPYGIRVVTTTGEEFSVASSTGGCHISGGAGDRMLFIFHSKQPFYRGLGLDGDGNIYAYGYFILPTSASSSPKLGMIYYDYSTHTVKVYTSTGWKALAYAA